jgi:hypothetical protein
MAILGPGWKGDFFELSSYSVDCVFNHSLCCCPSIFILDCHEDGSTVSTIRGTMAVVGSCLSMSRRTAIAATRDSGVRNVHCFFVTDIASLRVRSVITGSRAGSNISEARK